MDELTFRDLLSGLMKENMMNLSDLYRKMEGKKTVKSISYSRLQSYNSEKTIPDLQTAKEILRTLGNNMSDIEIQRILDYSQEKKKQISRDSMKYLSGSLRINPEYFGEFTSVEYLKSIINQRIDEIFSNDEVKELFRKYTFDVKTGQTKEKYLEGNFNLYITYLLMNDLKDFF